MPDKFSITELAALWRELLKSGFDSFQMAEAIKTFVTGYGYGISNEGALRVARSLPPPRGSVKYLRAQLEMLAFAM
jgi:hypothetical protein